MHFLVLLFHLVVTIISYNVETETELYLHAVIQSLPASKSVWRSTVMLRLQILFVLQ